MAEQPENVKKNHFKPGQSGNPNGRPKGARTRSTVLAELLQTVITSLDLNDIPKELTAEAAIINALIKKAMTGDIPAIKEVQDTMHGKLADKIEGGDPASPITHETLVIEKIRVLLPGEKLEDDPEPHETSDS